MPGISEADMNRIEEFVKRSQYERSPELLCPNEGEDGDEESDAERREGRSANPTA